jgi:hypothetical protein
VATQKARPEKEAEMPRAFSILISTIVGYLNGAGLGALSIELLSNHRDKELQTTLIALIVMGPLGALLGLLIAQLRHGGDGATAARPESD